MNQVFLPLPVKIQYITKTILHVINEVQHLTLCLFLLTCVHADPCGLYALWLLSIIHHAYELQAVDANI